MSHKTPFEFVERARQMPERIPLQLRRDGDWRELYGRFDAGQANHQAGRCLDCGVAYCAHGCPLGNRIPQWIELAREGRIAEAAALCHETNPLPEVCGRVCPQDRLCEGACTLHDGGFGAVSIGALEKYIVDTALAQGWRPDLSQAPRTGRRVAVVGAGPAGLSCADRLARAGVQAVVFDRYERIGGLLHFGIPTFKLERDVLAQRHAVLEGMGVQFRLGVEVGRDVALEALLQDFDAVFLGTGTYRYTDGGLPGQDLRGVLPALPFLVQNGRIVHGDAPDASRPIAGWESEVALPDLRGKAVVVLGGGDTGMDCVRSAVRLGAVRVTCVYRRDEAGMPGSAREVANAREEGVQFLFHRQPVALLGDTDDPMPASTGAHATNGDAQSGPLRAVRVVETRATAPDARGRVGVENVSGSETDLPADVAIIAFGFQPDPPAWLPDHGVRLQSNGRIAVGADGALPYQTAHPRLFAGGDAVRGADLVVTAAKEGRDAAASIVRSFAG